jgi:hypothetical protein
MVTARRIPADTRNGAGSGGGNDEDLALIRQLVALPPPPVPPGLAPRIVRDVQRLAQLPAQRRFAHRSRLFARIAPIASLAAAAAVFALILPRDAPVAAVSAPARVMAGARLAMVPPADPGNGWRAAPLAAAAVRALPVGHRPGLHRAVAPQPQPADAPAPVPVADSAASVPVVQSAGASGAPAMPGPVDLAAQTPGPAVTGPQGVHTGQMGPALPQGYGFAGASGAAQGEFGTPPSAGLPLGVGIPGMGVLGAGPAIGPGGRSH